MISHNIRLSRIYQPRATVWAMALLTIVFLGFGIWAEATMPAADSSALLLDAQLPAHGWLAQFTAVLQ